MDMQTIDQQYQQLQGQSQQTVQALQTLGGKLQAASQAGDQQAREWFLDLRELAIAFKSEQDQMTNLLQAIHGAVANQMNAAPQQLPPQQGGGWEQQPSYPQSQPIYPQGQPGYAAQPPQPQQGGGFLGNFLSSGFGRAIETGAGFGIGDDLINKLF
jgi:hypothetical protein